MPAIWLGHQVQRARPLVFADAFGRVRRPAKSHDRVIAISSPVTGLFPIGAEAVNNVAMPVSPLIPEQVLMFSPSLATTIGLEEAILLQQLHAVIPHRETSLRDGQIWLEIEHSYLQNLLPFWELPQLHCILNSLVEKGVLLIDASAAKNDDHLVFALNELVHDDTASTLATPRVTSQSTSQPQHTELPENWVPSEDLLHRLAQQHNVPRQFAADQLEDFVHYWRERGESHHAWDERFRQHVSNAWRRNQLTPSGAGTTTEPRPLNQDWRPSNEALEVLGHSDVDLRFVEDAIPEFILYWRERGTAPKELNTKFIQHVRQQWTRYQRVAQAGDTTPMGSDWQPSRELYDILQLSHIEEDFARSLIPEFILYWRESGQTNRAWNSKFLQHVKYHWAQRHGMRQPNYRSPGSTRDRSLEDDLSDTSWAT